MKEVLVLRHSERGKDGKLTQTGIDACLELATHLDPFDVVIASPAERTKQTAFLLSGVSPRVDIRAGLLEPTLEQTRLIDKAEGMEGSAVEIVRTIWKIPGLTPILQQSGEALLDVLQDTLSTLGDNKRALIISHNIMMLAMEKLIKNDDFDSIDYTVNKLEGFMIGEDMHLTYFGS